MGGYYSREGKRITLNTWGALHADPEYRVVAKTQVGVYEVSTVWLGLDHAVVGGPPLIFETMVFATEGYAHDLDQWRYSTEAQARQGHEEVVLLLRATVQEEPPGRDHEHNHEEGA